MHQLRIFIIILAVVSLVSVAFAAQDQQIQQRLSNLERIQGKFSFVVLGDNRSGDDAMIYIGRLLPWRWSESRRR
jgi:hypothetical protein